jgi:hypothetical protein
MSAGVRHERRADLGCLREKNRTACIISVHACFVMSERHSSGAGTRFAEGALLARQESTVSKPISIRFFQSMPDEGLLALASHRLEELPDSWRREAQCSVVVRRHKPVGARAVHFVQVDFDCGPSAARICAESSDPDPYAALSRAFDTARASMLVQGASSHAAGT